MLTINFLRQNKEEVINRLAVKNFNNVNLIDLVLEQDDLRKITQHQLDQLLAESNQLAKQIGQLFKEGKQAEANSAKEQTQGLKEQIKKLENEMEKAKDQIYNALVNIPNVPHISVPKGNSDKDNEVVFEWGNMPNSDNYQKSKKPHWDLAAEYNLIDFELGNKITGSGFPVYIGWGAKLQRALISYFLDKATAQGYEEVIPPYFVNEASGFGTGQLPDKEGQMYHITADNLYAIPTAEVPVTNIFRDVILNSNQFPIKKTAYSPCFRREAGSYGKDVRGLNRLHQFDKVEIVQIVHPKNSYEVLEEMQNYVQSILQELELPYRVLRLCGGDLSFTSALTYDMEVYSAAQERWLEVSSISNFENYQTNRLKVRFNNEEGKKELAHSLNGSALALPRIVAALLENNQTENGINIPKVLQPYMKTDIIVKND